VTWAFGKTITLGNGQRQRRTANGNNRISLVNSNYSVNVGNGNNSITLGSGNDTINLGNGSNTLAFGSQIGTDVVRGFHTSNSVIQFNHALFANYAAVPLGPESFDGHNTTIRVTGSSTESLTLEYQLLLHSTGEDE
jgi:Ca2+-binding RTX toxin-like protein